MIRKHVREPGTLHHAAALARSIARGPFQSAAVLAGLAGVATQGPLAGLACAAAGIAFVSARPRRKRLDALGRDEAQVARLDEEVALPLGREFGTGRAVVLGSEDARQHLLVLGSPCAGKTDFLLSLSEAAIAQGAGLLHMDASGGTTPWTVALQLARRHGREDDLLLLDMRKAIGPGDPRSNTMNPFAGRGSRAIVEMILDVMDATPGCGSSRTLVEACLTGVLGMIVHSRDAGSMHLSIPTVLDWITFEAIHDLRTNPTQPPEIVEGIDRYLRALPGYNPERGRKQARSVMEHHAVVEAEVTRALGPFDSYAGIVKRTLGDVDLAEVIHNRRILIVLLPPEGSAGGPGGVGRMILAALKGMMRTALGEDGATPSDASTGYRGDLDPPFLCILDGIGSYAVSGLARLGNLGRCMGLWMVYSDANIPALNRSGESEAAAMIANTGTKVFRSMDDDGLPPGPSPASSGGLFDVMDLAKLAPDEMLVLHKDKRIFASSLTGYPHGLSNAPLPNRKVAMLWDPR